MCVRGMRRHAVRPAKRHAQNAHRPRPAPFTNHCRRTPTQTLLSFPLLPRPPHQACVQQMGLAWPLAVAMTLNYGVSITTLAYCGRLGKRQVCAHGV